MKKILVIILAVMFISCAGMKAREAQRVINEQGIHVSIAEDGSAEIKRSEKQCSDCPADNPCGYSEYDGCNTCSGSTWCENDKWYSDGLGSCTAVYCSKQYEIENPFKDEK
jgi:hypothetical protein